MLLAINAGNMGIDIGLLDGQTVVFSARIGTDPGKTADEYAMMLQSVFALHRADLRVVQGAVAACVVTELKTVLSRAVLLLTGAPPLMVGAGVKTGLNIRIENPAQLGSDMVAAAVAACTRYPRPLAIFDMGTATTVSVVDGDGMFLGGMIIPGLRLGVEALSAHTSQLPRIDLDLPGALIGTNTIDCMKSGALYGTASMLDGVAERLEGALNAPLATLLATGELADKVIPLCRRNIILDPHLTLHGLGLIYQKNMK